MARRIVHQIVDDLDGTILEAGAGETVSFSLDGVAYEIDLTEAHAGALRDVLAPYIDAGRSISSPRSATPTGNKRRRTGQTDYAPVREWAKANGYSVSERGRVPAAILEAYEAAQDA